MSPRSSDIGLMSCRSYVRRSYVTASLGGFRIVSFATKTGTASQPTTASQPRLPRQIQLL